MIKRDTDYKPVDGIQLKSPLAIGGYFLHYLRIRFSETFGAPYIWKPQEEETDLFIVSGGVVDNEIRGNRPAIYVNVGPASSNALVINDRADDRWGVTHKFSYNRVNVGMTIRVESNTKGECHNLGWYTYRAILSGKDVLRHKYHFSNFGEVQLVPPQPSKVDRETYICTINFSIVLELTWNVSAVQTFIKEISYKLDLESKQDPTKFLTEIYLQGVGDTTHREYPTINRTDSNAE